MMELTALAEGVTATVIGSPALLEHPSPGLGTLNTPSWNSNGSDSTLAQPRGPVSLQSPTMEHSREPTGWDEEGRRGGSKALLKRRILEILFVLVAISLYAWVRHQSSPPERTWLALDSPQGEYVGQGKAWRFSPDNAQFKADYPDKKAERGVRVEVKGPGQDYFWLEFAAPNLQKLVPGHYPNAARYAFRDPHQPGLQVLGCGRGNNRLLGTFEVLEIADGESGPTRLAIDFVQYGEENRKLPLKGSIRYHSSIK